MILAWLLYLIGEMVEGEEEAIGVLAVVVDVVVLTITAVAGDISDRKVSSRSLKIALCDNVKFSFV
jgi:hypothetical protein